jgi:hypothetical protein
MSELELARKTAAAAISLIAHRPDDRCTLGPLLARVKALRQWRRSLVAQHGASPTPLWAEEKQLQQKAQSKQAGLKGANDFDRPSAKRKR